MASKLLGRTACPIRCGNEAAHVKLKTDKGEGKTAFPYVHCPACGAQLHTKCEDQASYLLALARPEKNAATPTPTPTPTPSETATPTPTPTPRQENPPPAPEKRGLSRSWRSA